MTLRVVVNGMATTPVRLMAVEAEVRGQVVKGELAEEAVKIAIRSVKSLAHNGYKVLLLKNIVTRLIHSAGV